MSLAQVFSCEFAKFLRTLFLIEHFRWLLLSMARKRYNFIFKQAVIKHAEEKSNREATRKYSVDEIAVSIWGWLQLTVFSSKLWLLFEGGLYPGKYGIFKCFSGIYYRALFFLDKSWYRRTVLRAQIVFRKSLYRSNPKKTFAVQ